MIKLIFLKELTVIRQSNHKSVIFVTICIFLNKGFKFQSYVCNRFHDLSMMPVNLSNIYILHIKNADYNGIISGISKSEAIKLF